MKRFLIALLYAVAAVAATAQTPENEEIVKASEGTGCRQQTLVTGKGVSNPDNGPTTCTESSDTSSKQIIGPQNDDLVLYTDDRSGILSISLGGYEIALGSHETGRRKVSASKLGIGLTSMDIGFIALTEPDYTDYDPEQKGFMSLRGGKSVHVGMDVIRYQLTLNRRSPRTLWRLHTGLNFSWDNLTFCNDITLGTENGKTVPIALDGDYKISKYKITRIGIPVGISLYDMGTRLGVQLSVNNSLLLNDRLKYKKPNVKKNFSGAASFQSSIRMAVKYRKIGVYAEYALTPLFKNGCGPKCNIYSFGFTFGSTFKGVSR